MIKLVPMEEEDFQAYLKTAIEDYANEHVKAGNWQPSEALAKSEQEFHQLLPKGVSSEKQYLFTICDANSGNKVGMIWFAVLTKPLVPMAFIYDFRVNEQYRGKGYGTQALLAIEDQVKELGIKSIGLHVFGHNTIARALYEKAGYRVTNVQMVKELNS